MFRLANSLIRSRDRNISQLLSGHNDYYFISAFHTKFLRHEIPPENQNFLTRPVFLAFLKPA